MTVRADTLKVPALRALQGKTTVYVLFLRGIDLLRVADIDRVRRREGATLHGFQRREIREHVNEIARYLSDGGALFPNAIILGLEPGMKFDRTRGPLAQRTSDQAASGRLSIPIRDPGDRPAWIVDGQQRSLALAKSKNESLVVPIVAFEAASIRTLREQFILVNRARPLPQRLIDELLPVTATGRLPRDLTDRQLPSRLCDALNTDETSPLRGLVRRASQAGNAGRFIIDTAVLTMIRRSLQNPIGALAGFRSLNSAERDANEMLRLLIEYWSAVKAQFPSAWGRPPSESRLMHYAGVVAMGDLMDRIAARAPNIRKSLRTFFAHELSLIADDCAWTHGRWASIGRNWDEVQATPKDVKLLSQVLAQLHAERSAR